MPGEKMEKHQNFALDTAGNVINGASVNVYDSGGAVATIYEDDETTALSQPLTTGATSSRGEFAFKAANGEYTVTVTNGGTSWSYSATLYDPATTLAGQEANNVAITGGSITGITDLAVADGGTGASTAADARANLEAAGLVASPTAGNLASLTAGGDIQDAGVAASALLSTADAATQADQETGTSTTTYVSPGRQHYHPSAVKAWVVFNGTGTVAIHADYGVSSITDDGAGLYTVNLSSAFSSASAYATLPNLRAPDGASGNYSITELDSGRSTTSCKFIASSSGGTNYDSDYVSIAFLGDL